MDNVEHILLKIEIPTGISEIYMNWISHSGYTCLPQTLPKHYNRWNLHAINVVKGQVEVCSGLLKMIPCLSSSLITLYAFMH